MIAFLRRTLTPMNCAQNQAGQADQDHKLTKQLTRSALSCPELARGTPEVREVTERVSVCSAPLCTAHKQCNTPEVNLEANAAVREIYEILPGRLHYSLHDSEEMTISEITSKPDHFFFSSNCQEMYTPFCSDFGPVCMGVLHNFCGFMREYMNNPSLTGRKMVYYSSEDIDIRTNCALLIAAYLVIDFDMTPEQAWMPFEKMPKDSFATFRDATYCEQDYGLPVLECLRGLFKAMRLGWYDRDDYDVYEYFSLSDPATANMTLVTPEFVAFKGPVSPKNNCCLKDDREFADFPPEHYVSVFRDLGVTDVVRLNGTGDYSSESFTEHGFNHHQCYFSDCTTPSNAIVETFLRVAESSTGLVAVHCRAGLGRTGTLIAIYMMKHYGFTASECIGWLRLVRPGSVLGPQQQYLHWAEENLITKHPGKSVPEYTSHISPEEAKRMGELVAQAQLLHTVTKSS